MKTELNHKIKYRSLAFCASLGAALLVFADQQPKMQTWESSPGDAGRSPVPKSPQSGKPTGLRLCRSGPEKHPPLSSQKYLSAADKFVLADQNNSAGEVYKHLLVCINKSCSFQIYPGYAPFTYP